MSLTGFFILGLIFLLIFYLVVKNNSFIAAEQQIAARYEASRASLTKTINKLKSMGITTQKYIDTFQQVLQRAIDGKYKDKNSLLAILENTQGLPSDIFEKMQLVIDSEYDDFYASQVVLQDAYRAYITDTKTFPGVLVTLFLKFPKQEFLAKGYDRMVLSPEAEAAFEKGTLDPINPFGS